MTVADRVLAALGPAVAAQAGPLLAPLVEALTAELDAVDRLVSDTDTAVGWGGALDLDTTEAPAWLAQLVGVAVPAGLDTEAARAYARERGGWRRGTPAALVAAVRSTLIGSQVVELVERDAGDPYRVRVRVYASQVRDLDSTTTAARGEKPAGVTLVVEVRPGATYAHLTAVDGVTYADLAARFGTYDATSQHVPESEGT